MANQGVLKRQQRLCTSLSSPSSGTSPLLTTFSIPSSSLPYPFLTPSSPLPHPFSTPSAVISLSCMPQVHLMCNTHKLAQNWATSPQSQSRTLKCNRKIGNCCRSPPDSTPKTPTKAPQQPLPAEGAAPAKAAITTRRWPEADLADVL